MRLLSIQDKVGFILNSTRKRNALKIAVISPSFFTNFFSAIQNILTVLLVPTAFAFIAVFYVQAFLSRRKHAGL